MLKLSFDGNCSGFVTVVPALFVYSPLYALVYPTVMGLLVVLYIHGLLYEVSITHTLWESWHVATTTRTFPGSSGGCGRRTGLTNVLQCTGRLGVECSGNTDCSKEEIYSDVKAIFQYQRERERDSCNSTSQSSQKAYIVYTFLNCVKHR
jgi:hypothetical protein